MLLGELWAMLKYVESKRSLLDWQLSGAGLAWLLALGWWLVLSWPLRRTLRSALGGAVAGWPAAGPPTKPRRPKASPRHGRSHLPYPSAA
ncbi:hypothetical protein [Hymenobacter psoromatis]|uniref:hypothetical protein n=1 Tax=Hymenobacter psoromatis TaxID=1484116 RepID=UPI001CBB750F|nr:hypothetical protein [Hymenobacter psoromatis]